MVYYQLLYCIANVKKIERECIAIEKTWGCQKDNLGFN